MIVKLIAAVERVILNPSYPPFKKGRNLTSLGFTTSFIQQRPLPRGEGREAIGNKTGTYQIYIAKLLLQ